MQSHAQRLDTLAPPPPNREALIDAMAGKFYVDEPGHFVTNGLSTELIVFPSDLEPRRQRHLDDMIGYAMNYATTVRDVHEFNALRLIPNTQVEPDSYATIGLYLYFADECSRLKGDPDPAKRPDPAATFLSELRKAKVSVKYGDFYNRDKLADNLKSALKNLKMDDPQHMGVVDEWARYGTFTVQGDINQRLDDAGNITGAYARLARDICKKQTLLGMNLPISYALGNKSNMQGMSAEDAYRFTQNLTEPFYNENQNVHIRDAIREGDAERKRRIHEAIAAQLGPLKDTDAGSSRTQDARTGRSILELLPDSTLEMLHRQGYTIAYSNHDDISTCYPKEPMPGKNVGTAAAGNKGDRELHYRTIFISNGLRDFNSTELQTDEKLRFKVAAQVLAHEACHNAIEYLKPDEETQLKQAVIAVGREIVQKKRQHTLPAYMDDKLKTIVPNSLASTLSYISPQYAYARDRVKNPGGQTVVLSDDRWLEVACNTFSLMQTEFPPDSPINNPYRDLPSLAALKDKLVEVHKLAVERSRVQNPQVEMPQAKRGFGEKS